ncbi:MAG: hypothetical protein K9L62_00325 [Vallitaleaceae bacterium]|nr:hypothetical protein [Vallitaleaceae bacterium]
MDCNNKYCYWQAFDQCCHESEEGHKNATPDQLDCPSSLRKDFEEGLHIVAHECKNLINKRCLRELLDVKKFMLQQENAQDAL